MRRVQLRGGARRLHARRTRVGGVRGHVWAPQTKVRRPACLARYVARQSRAPSKQLGPYHRSSYGFEIVMTESAMASAALAFHIERACSTLVVPSLWCFLDSATNRLASSSIALASGGMFMASAFLMASSAALHWVGHCQASAGLTPAAASTASAARIRTGRVMDGASLRFD